MLWWVYVTPVEEVSEKKHCAEGVFSWCVQLISCSPPHGARSRGSGAVVWMAPGTAPTETRPLIAILVALRERKDTVNVQNHMMLRKIGTIETETSA